MVNYDGKQTKKHPHVGEVSRLPREKQEQVWASCALFVADHK